MFRAYPTDTYYPDEALLLQSKISHLRQPQARVLVALRHYFQVPTHILLGKAKKFLDNQDDLVSLKSPVEVDYLSDFLRRHLVGNVRATPPYLLRHSYTLFSEVDQLILRVERADQ